ncbi:MAG: hypothetical protein HF962_01320 [Sulfurovum sp.]|nr:hypothetical protein [Sulfurovum sp.]
MEKRPAYNPLYWLAALGAGGLSVSFFMYINFMIEHKGTPMATFDYVYPALIKGDWLSIVTALSLIAILIFAFLHIKLVLWNLKEFKAFKQTEIYQKLKSGNSEVTLMAMPLALAMTINVFFVIGAVFIPGLWGVVEYLFPFAFLGFAAVGYLALKIFYEYLSRLLVTGDFDFTQNNSLAQMLSIFTFAMIAVGMAAPGAMSNNLTINAIGIAGAIFFLSISFLLLLIKIVLGFKSMFRHGISKEASPSLWIIIPILTLIGITLVRINFGLDHHFDSEVPKASFFTLTVFVISFQLIFGILGYSVMKKVGYFETFVHGDNKSVPSFALICPGVALTVMIFFVIQFGLVMNGVVEKYSVWYFLLFIPAIYLHYKTAYYFFKLKTKFAL